MDQKEKIKYLIPLVELCKNYLFRSEAKEELDYLESRVDRKHFDLFNFGFFPKSKSSFLNFIDEYGTLIKEDPIKVLLELQIIYESERNGKLSPFFKYHSVIIPFYDPYGKPIALVGRTLLSDDKQKELKVSKYKNTKFEKRKYLYGLNYSYRNIINKNKAIIVEGQFDFISGYLNGFNNICALGSAKFTPENIAMLKRYTNNFAVLLDNDAAGDCGYEKMRTIAPKYGVNLTRLFIPDNYKDLDLYIKDNKDYGVKLEEI